VPGATPLSGCQVPGSRWPVRGESLDAGVVTHIVFFGRDGTDGDPGRPALRGVGCDPPDALPACLAQRGNCGPTGESYCPEVARNDGPVRPVWRIPDGQLQTVTAARPDVRIRPLCVVRNYVKLRAAVTASLCSCLLRASRVALKLHIVFQVSRRWLPRQQTAMKPDTANTPTQALKQRQGFQCPHGRPLALRCADPATSHFRPVDRGAAFRDGLKLCEEPSGSNAGQLWSRHGNFT
jgi:hypothetical protein